MQTASRTLSATIRAELARRDLKQRDLAEALGMTTASISRRLSGKAGDWTVSEVESVARFLGVPFVELFDVATDVA
jgi:transcriptional regulator with XRE-family HTH domain